MSAPDISIIIPVYNNAKELAECLASIHRQTLKPSEVIIVDDGSGEPIGKIEGSCVIRQENRGAPAARNRGFKESRGEYVIFCDADVVMRPNMLATMSKVLDENPDVSYAYSSFKFGWKKFKLWEFSADKLRQMPYIHTTSLMRRKHFPGFDESLKRLQDWDLWLKMLAEGHSGTWINEVLFTVTSGGTISRWLPSFLAGRNTAYRHAVLQVKRKHHLT
ncbi:MAG: glycosyltransferase family A protein [Patescibacteria group bacterium]|nr:glycosyltransferase family A protein [Patescibacteria group bacterium]